jgi:hypothetical protein
MLRPASREANVLPIATNGENFAINKNPDATLAPEVLLNDERIILSY